MTDSRTKPDLIEDLQVFAEELGKTPTKEEMNEYGPHYGKLYQDKFGTWNNALEAAGLEPNLVHNIQRDDLLEDIERVANVLNKTPTLDEMDTYGRYSRLTYQHKLGSFVGTLEEIGLTPSYSQYNFSNTEAPPELQATKNVRKLREDGPASITELPLDSTSASDKQHGLTKFSVNSGKTGDGLVEPVYYLFDNHNPGDVIRKFFQTNPQVLENRSRKAITEEVGGYGKDWADALKVIFEDFDGAE